MESGEDYELIQKAQSAVDAAQKDSDRAARRVAKTKARLDDAVQELKRLGIVPEEEHATGSS